MHRLTACNNLQRVPWGSTNVGAMSSTQDTNNSQHWRERAAQMRLLAIKMAGSQAAILINDLAADYEKLAERAEIKANGKKPRSNGKPRQAVSISRRADRSYGRVALFEVQAPCKSSNLCCRSQ